MSEMSTEFDSVRELTLEEMYEVSGGPFGKIIVEGAKYLGRVARDTAVGTAMAEAYDDMMELDWGPNPTTEQMRTLRQA